MADVSGRRRLAPGSLAGSKGSVSHSNPFLLLVVLMKKHARRALKSIYYTTLASQRLDNS
jgi:hypothetical protein